MPKFLLELTEFARILRANSNGITDRISIVLSKIIGINLNT